MHLRKSLRNSTIDPHLVRVQDAIAEELKKRAREYQAAAAGEGRTPRAKEEQEQALRQMTARIEQVIRERVPAERLAPLSRLAGSQLLQREVAIAGREARSGTVRAQTTKRLPEVEAALQVWYPTAQRAARDYTKTRFIRETAVQQIGRSRVSEAHQEFAAQVLHAWIEYFVRQPVDVIQRTTPEQIAAQVQLRGEEVWKAFDTSEDITAQRRAGFGQKREDTVLEIGTYAQEGGVTPDLAESLIQEAEGAWDRLKAANHPAWVVITLNKGMLRIAGHPPRGSVYSTGEIAKLTRMSKSHVEALVRDAESFLKADIQRLTRGVIS